MKNRISYHWGEEYLLITMGNRIDNRIKMLLWTEFFFTTGMATIFMKGALPISGSMLHWMASFSAAVLYLVAAYRFASRMFFSETLVVDNKTLTIIQRTPFVQNSHSYAWMDMSAIHYSGKPDKTDHPLKGRCYDYFGFETQEHLIQDLHHNGNMCFYCDGSTVRFGKGVYSWDAEEIVHMMKLYAGSSVKLGPEWSTIMQQHAEWDDA